jgi:uncharacterized membrane protein
MEKKEKIKKYVNKTRLIKTITWRVISWIATFGIAFALTGNVGMAVSFGFADTIIKGTMYWVHEYKWDKITNKKIKKIKVTYSEIKPKRNEVGRR